MKILLTYLARLMSDRAGDPSAKRYACALFGISAVVFGALNYNTETIALFLMAALGESITSVFEKGKSNDK